MRLPLRDAENFSRALDFVNGIRRRRRFKVKIEEQVTVEWLATKPNTTADLVMYVSDEMHIVDLKTGKIPVEVIDNRQMLYYAASYGHLAPKAKGVWLHIVQPWANVTESWFADTMTLAQFMNDASATEAAIQAGSTQFTPGHHCQFCPANPRGRGLKGQPLCPTLMDLYYPRLIDEDEILNG